MPSDSSIAILQATSPDKYLHSSSRSYGGTTKEDQYTHLADPARVTYAAFAQAVSIATSAAHAIFIQADGTNYTKIWGIDVQEVGLPSASLANFLVIRTTTAGSGGTSVSGFPMDGADTSPYGGTIQTLPTAKGTEGSTLFGYRLPLAAANPLTLDNKWSWRADANQKPITIGTAATGGICLKIVTGITSATVDLTLWFWVTATL